MCHRLLPYIMTGSGPATHAVRQGRAIWFVDKSLLLARYREPGSRVQDLTSYQALSVDPGPVTHVALSSSSGELATANASQDPVRRQVRSGLASPCISLAYIAASLGRERAAEEIRDIRVCTTSDLRGSIIFPKILTWRRKQASI